MIVSVGSLLVVVGSMVRVFELGDVVVASGRERVQILGCWGQENLPG